MKTHNVILVLLAVLCLGMSIVIFLVYKEKPIYTTMLTFDSDKNTGRQEIFLPTLQPGKYIIMLDNVNKYHSGHWVVWDHLALTDNGKHLWEIGNDDGSSTEFCDPQKLSWRPYFSRCTTMFKVGSTKSEDFSISLNDGDFPEAIVEFNVANQQIDSPTLVLNTLDSVHVYNNRLIDHFDMEISLWRETELRKLFPQNSTIMGGMYLSLSIGLGAVSLILFVIFLLTFS